MLFVPRLFLSEIHLLFKLSALEIKFNEVSSIGTIES